MAAIFFFSGLILFSLGLIGEYIGRMFLGMGNNPQFVVREIYTKDSDSSVNFEDLGETVTFRDSLKEVRIFLWDIEYERE